ncbi:MAG: DUF2207 domain-containing protein [Clostridia bacterium]|nr:DUF2207 domain-containing protein [Clostridia bacterium]
MNRKKRWNKRRLITLLLTCLLALVCLTPFAVFKAKDGGRYETNEVMSEAYSYDYIRVESYGVKMFVKKNRQVDVQERITITFLRSGLTMFYRSLPTAGARYENFNATCEGNENFSFYVADNPDMDGFVDVNCVGNANKGKTWTYNISYTMEQANSKMRKNRLMLDVIGFGWTVPLHNVTASVTLPERPLESQTHTDVFGTASNNRVETVWEPDGKTVTLRADELDLVYNEEFDERVAGGVTFDVTFEEGVLSGYTTTRLFTRDMWKIVLAVFAVLAGAILILVYTRNKREVVTVVNIKAPDKMSPIKMGKWLDGTVNNEDITSMIYYFANSGYLRIDFTDENDPLLIACVRELPENAPAYEKTLFDGLFENADIVNGWKQAHVSKIAGKFYESSQIAVKQVPDAPKMYENKSVLGYILGGIVGILLAFFVPFFMSMRLGGGYTYLFGFIMVLPVAVVLALGYIKENYRYKWKMKAKLGMLLAQIAVMAISTLLVCIALAPHIMTGYEKLVMCVGVFGACMITQGALSRTEEYLETIGDILGFKEFIVVTEEEKIKFMLEENPELYYKVLPYAQVLGVTDEWEQKFEKILMKPPYWYSSSTQVSAFDCYLISRCMNRSMAVAIAKAISSSAGGGHIGRSGGGGSFGGFGGGGFGGGGGGAR